MHSLIKETTLWLAVASQAITAARKQTALKPEGKLSHLMSSPKRLMAELATLCRHSFDVTHDGRRCQHE